MVADDEIYMLEALDKLIDWGAINCQLIYKAKNGKEILEKMEEEVPDILVTDIRMPMVSGIEIAKYIYEHTIPTKVIFLTAYADFEYAREGIEYDICGYVVKTSALEKLPQMLQKAIRKLSQPVVLSKAEKSQSEDIFGRLEKYISQHYMDKLTLTGIANEIHSNGSYLSRLYKMRTGENLFDAINKKKLEKAKEFLCGGKRISEAAGLVGFDDVSYFSRIFKKYENCTPREYEKRMHQKN